MGCFFHGEPDSCDNCPAFDFLCSVQTDYIIVGQGIAGTFLSYYLLKQGKRVLVIDEARPFTSSKVASGIINPVTGKRIATTWLADKLIPFCRDAYAAMEQDLNVPLISGHNILEFHPTSESRAVFDNKLQKGSEYLQHIPDEAQWAQYFRYNYGIGQISPCWLIDIQNLLPAWRRILQQQDMLLEERFDMGQCIVNNEGVQYKGVHAEKIIFCDGVDGFDNPYFSLLPYTRNKGEALIVSIPGLPREHGYKQGMKIVPWHDDLFWVGASFEWEFSNPHPTPAYRKKLESQLDYWLRIPYETVDHIAAERPVTVERIPFVGLHPLHPAVGVFNGMGTKGCSLGPYLAQQFARHLVYGEQIQPEADIKRFSGVLGRAANKA
jgi:glycine/D-amino acid oxidase-like deaminating enzyme